MGVEKKTILTYGIKVPAKEIIEFIKIKIGRKKYDEKYWFEDFLYQMEYIGIDSPMNYIDGPTDNDDHVYIGIKKGIEVGEVFNVNPYILISEYNRIFTKEIKTFLYPFFEGKELELVAEKLLVRVVWK